MLLSQFSLAAAFSTHTLLHYKHGVCWFPWCGRWGVSGVAGAPCQRVPPEGWGGEHCVVWALSGLGVMWTLSFQENAWLLLSAGLLYWSSCRHSTFLVASVKLWTLLGGCASWHLNLVFRTFISAAFQTLDAAVIDGFFGLVLLSFHF